MVSNITLKRGSVAGTTVLTTELNSLGNAAACALSSAVANATNLDRIGRCELNVTFGSSPTANSTVDLYLVPALDGTNYADYSTTGPVVDPNTYVGSFVLRATTSAQRRMSPWFPLPAADFKLGVVNNSGQAFPASGSTVKLLTELDQSS